MAVSGRSRRGNIWGFLVFVAVLLLFFFTNPSRAKHEAFINSGPPNVPPMVPLTAQQMQDLGIKPPPNTPVITIDYNNYFLFSTAERKVNGQTQARTFGLFNMIWGRD